MRHPVVLSAVLLGLASCAETPEGVALAAEGSGANEATLTYFLLTSFGGPSGADEQLHRRASSSGDDSGGDFCVAPVPGEVFDRLAAAVQAARSATPDEDVPFPGPALVLEEDGTRLPQPYYAFGDTVVYSARSADDRWLAFDGGNRVRDLDGLLYEVEGDGRDRIERLVLTALIDSDACPDMTDVFRQWRERV